MPLNLNELLSDEYNKRISSLSDTVETKKQELDELESQVKNLKDLERKFRFYVDPETIGVRATLHKKDDIVDIVFHSSGGVAFDNLKELKEKVASLSDVDFVLDCKMLKDKDKTGIFVFDVLYYGEDLTGFPLYKRKSVLKQLNFNDVVRESPSVVIKNADDFRSCLDLFKKLGEEQGLVFRHYDSLYFGVWAKLVMRNAYGEGNKA